MRSYPNAFGGISLRVYDMEGLLEKYEETPGANIKEQVLTLIQEELGVRYEMEDPEGVYYFSTQPDFICDIETFSDLAMYAEGVGEFTFPDSPEYEPENTTRRIYLHDGRVYEDIPEIIWHPPVAMDLSDFGHVNAIDDPVDIRLEELCDKYKDGICDVLQVSEGLGGIEERRGVTLPLKEGIALAEKKEKASPDLPVIIKTENGREYTRQDLIKNLDSVKKKHSTIHLCNITRKKYKNMQRRNQGGKSR